jgi:hypothetical protein
VGGKNFKICFLQQMKTIFENSTGHEEENKGDRITIKFSGQKLSGHSPYGLCCVLVNSFFLHDRQKLKIMFIPH